MDGIYFSPALLFTLFMLFLLQENESADARTASQKADANKDKDAPSTTDSCKSK